MCKRAFLLCMVWFAGTAVAQPQFQQFIGYVTALPESERGRVTDSFITARASAGFPVVEGPYGIFIYRGGVTSASVAGDYNSWSSTASPMVKVSGTSFFYFSRQFENNARVDYKYVTNGSNWILDPLNPRICSGGFGPNSEFAMPGYMQPAEIQFNPAVPHGSVTAFTLSSTSTGTSFQVKVYTPPGYDTAGTVRYSSVWFQDGYEYIDLASAVNVLDNVLAAGASRPLIAVFVRPNNRNDEYAGAVRNAYRLFFANELVPYIDARYKTNAAAAHRLVIGDSYGANISALIAWNHPDVFGNLGLHSSAFQPNGYEAQNLYLNNPARNIKIFSVWGTYEPIWSGMRNFRDVLRGKGYTFGWLEFPEGHSWGLWRANIDTMLAWFFPPLPSAVAERAYTGSLRLLGSYPNPFTHGTAICFSIPAEGEVTIAVFNTLGGLAATPVNGIRMPAGEHKVNFTAGGLPAGVYYYRVTYRGASKTGALVLQK